MYYFQVSERDRNLDNAILQSGKFNDALRNLIEWMKETEDLVANQKPPSPDYKVAKAQLQEQKVGWGFNLICSKSEICIILCHNEKFNFISLNRYSDFKGSFITKFNAIMQKMADLSKQLLPYNLWASVVVSMFIYFFSSCLKCWMTDHQV